MSTRCVRDPSSTTSPPRRTSQSANSRAPAPRPAKAGYIHRLALLITLVATIALLLGSMVLVGTLGFRPRRRPLAAARPAPALPSGLGDALLALAAAAADLRARLDDLGAIGRANLRTDAHQDPQARPLWRRLNDAGHHAALAEALAARDHLRAQIAALDPAERAWLADELAALAPLDQLTDEAPADLTQPILERALLDLDRLDARLAHHRRAGYRDAGP